MTPVWLVLHSEPRRVFAFNLADVREHVDSGDSTLCLLEPIGPLRSDSEGQTANIDFVLRNTNGVLSRMFALPPIRCQADLMSAVGLLFTGTVKAVELAGETCTLKVQA